MLEYTNAEVSRVKAARTSAFGSAHAKGSARAQGRQAGIHDLAWHLPARSSRPGYGANPYRPQALHSKPPYKLKPSNPETLGPGPFPSRASCGKGRARPERPKGG